MGYLKNKYTKEYFTGQDNNGKKLNYGVEGYEDFLKGKIRSIDLSILNQINFKDKKVLELGCGRGEAIKYGIDNGATKYDAVDFSENAIKIARNFIKTNKVKNANLFCKDALIFLKKNKSIKYDIIIMFDFIEHVPREELSKIFKLIHNNIHNKSLIAINTPNFKYDNDVIVSGLDDRNNIASCDTSDLNEFTSGMHCNKYTTVSLQDYLKKHDYINISEQHFYIPSVIEKLHPYRSYKIQWDNSFLNKLPIKEKYIDDIVESTHNPEESPKLVKLSKGNLKDVRLILTKTYYQNVFVEGEYDKELFDDFQKNTCHKEIILDVGGFMGVDSLLFSKVVGPKGKIISFEPNPHNLNRMLLNFSKNYKLSKNISVINTALSNNTEDTEFILSNDIDNGYSSTSRLINTHVEHSQKYLEDIGFYRQKVNQDTLDNFIKNTKLLPNIIKVDIEGAEHLLLLGAQKYLKKHSPVLYIELHSQYCALKCTEIMDSLGYKNNILFEEPDNRILVKYYKDNSKKSKNNIKISEIEQKITKDQINSLTNNIGKLNNQNNKLTDEIAGLNNQNNKLTDKIAGLNNQNSKLTDEKRELDKKFNKLEKYLIKLINNPIIKTELKIFRLLKKLI